MCSTICSAPASSRPQEVLSQSTAGFAAGLRAPSAAGGTPGVRSLTVWRISLTKRGELRRAGGRFAAPERNGGRGAVRVLDEDATGRRDAADPPRGVAEQHDVARHALDRKVFVDRADDDPVRFGDDRVEPVSGIAPPLVIAARRAPRRARSRPFTRSRCRYAAYRPRRAAMPFDSISTMPWNSARVRFRYGYARRIVSKSLASSQSSAAHIATICWARMSSGASGTISRSSSPRLMARTSAAHSTSSSRVVANSRPLGTAPRQWPARPIRCSATAIDRGDPTWHTRSIVPDVDPQLERGRGDERSQLASLQAPLGLEPDLSRQTAVVRRHEVGAHALGKVQRDAFREPARVHEHERGPVLGDERGDPVVDLAPQFLRRDRSQLAVRRLDGQVELAPRRDRDHDRQRTAVAAQKMRDRLNRLLRRRQADPDQRSLGQRFKAFEREGQVGRRACRRPQRGSRRRSPS